MRLCIISPKESKEALILKEAAEERGHECKRVSMKDIYFEVEESVFSAKHRRIDLLEFDVFLFRSLKRYFKEAMLLAEYLDAKGKVVIDKSLANRRFFSVLDKFHLSQRGVPQLDMVLTNSLKSARDVLIDIEHPILIKPISEVRKKAIISEDWTDSYDFARTNKDKTFLFLKYLEVDSFNRYFLIGNKVIGGIKRGIDDKELKLQFSSKFKSSNLDKIPEEHDLAKKAVKALGFEVASVDIVEYQNKHYVLNVKRSPKFSRFARISKENYAQRLIEYIEGKC